MKQEPLFEVSPAVASMTMPFGRFRGRRLTVVPFYYLTWLTDQPWVSRSLRDAIDAELARRFRGLDE